MTVQSTNSDKSDEAVHGHEAMIDLQQQEASMAARYGANNPDLQRIRMQIATLGRTMSTTSNARTSTAAAPSPLRQQVEQEIVMDNAQLAPLEPERTRYEALVASLGTELSRLEEADLALRTTTTRLDALNDNLKSLQARFQQARTQEQTELAKQVSVVQVAPALAPDKAVKPKKIIFLGAALVAGMIIAGGIVVGSILTNTTIASEDAAERLIGLPVLVSMPMRGPPHRAAAPRAGMKLGWYVRRLRGMSAGEVAGRVKVAARQRYWASPSRRPDPGTLAAARDATGRGGAATAGSAAGCRGGCHGRRRRPADGGRVAGVPPARCRGGGRPRLVRRPAYRTARAARRLRLRGALPRRSAGGKHQVRLGAVAAPGDDRAGHRLVADR